MMIFPGSGIRPALYKSVDLLGNIIGNSGNISLSSAYFMFPHNYDS